jgi:CheY-like chemotaxis protein
MPIPQHPPKLLIIDDSPDFQSLIKTYLEDVGIVCLFATDVVQATSAAVREQPNLILLDIGLPGGGGLLLLNRLRANLRTANIPVIVITAQTTPGLESQVRSQGAEEFLLKPLQKELFIATLRRVLSKPPPQKT